jgi:hypothetical protein
MEKIIHPWACPSATRLDFLVDKLTRSVEHSVSGESYETLVLPVAQSDRRLLFKNKGWLFDWKKEMKRKERTVYKLVLQAEPALIMGLVSLEKREGHIFMHLLESAAINRGPDKIFLGVAGNLVAYACKESMVLKMEGYVAFYAKNSLLLHYEKTLGASRKGTQLMVIEPPAAIRLVNHYFKNFTL